LLDDVIDAAPLVVVVVVPQHSLKYVQSLKREEIE